MTWLRCLIDCRIRDISVADVTEDEFKEDKIYKLENGYLQGEQGNLVPIIGFRWSFKEYRKHKRSRERINL